MSSVEPAHRLKIYLPQDRLRALARNEPLPERCYGAALFADISGFTPLTEKLTQELGIRRGIEELARRINQVYEALIDDIERFGGSVIEFAGDAITCWFDEHEGLSMERAISGAQAMQRSMQTFANLAIKIAITCGSARRFVVGDPNYKLIDILAGATITRLSTAEHLANRSEILVDENIIQRMGASIEIRSWRTAENLERFAVLGDRLVKAPPNPLETRTIEIPAEVLKPWLQPMVYERESGQHGAFLTELRPTVPVFVRFSGIDYDTDEQAQEKLDGFICRVQAILNRYEGTLLQITVGDKGSYLYASFGSLSAHEDDALRAVIAAAALQELPKEYTYLQPLQIGISRGTMRTGPYGGKTRHAYGALGDETNLAARLMTTAEPGEVLISGKVHKLVAGAFYCQPRPPLPIKGKAEPLPVFAVTGTRSTRAIRLEEPNYPLPMMGRAAELKLIVEKLELALQGQGQIIGITAEAGLGKSRLVAETIRLAYQRGFTGFGGSCESSGTNTPYLAWRSIWRAFFNVDSAASLRRQIRNLEGEIEDTAPAKTEALPVLSTLLDIPIEDNEFTSTLTPEDRRNVLTVLLEECLRYASHEDPLLLVLEDVHWIDPLSLDLLDKLARSCARLPICIVLAYRPPESTHSNEWSLEKLPHFTHVKLKLLSLEESEQLIRAKLAQLFPERQSIFPRALISELANRAEGNPFFMEELINYLRDRGLNPFEVQVRTLDLPSSLHVLILSRMDQLKESQKIILKTASIIGRLFSLSWLLGYYPELGEKEPVQTDLAELSRLDLTPLDIPEPDVSYLFKHIITHQVAYESIAYAMRTQLHEQLAEFIEGLGADRHLEQLAYHYGLSENALKQRDYFQKAGDAAQALYANEAAMAYYDRLLPLISEPQALIELHMKRGNVLILMGKWDEAEKACRSALAVSQPIGNAQASVRAQRLLGSIYRKRGDYPTALEWLERASAELAGQEGDLEMAQVLVEIGKVQERTGNYIQARQNLEAGLSLARKHNDSLLTAKILLDLGSVSADLGNQTQARAFFTESLDLYRRFNDKQGIGVAINNLGLVATSQGDFPAAQALFEESLALRQEIGDKQGVAASLGNLGRVAYEQGDYAVSLKFLEDGLALAREIGDQRGILFSLINLGVRLQNQGDPAKARPYYEEGLELAREQGTPSAVAIALMNLGVVSADLGEYDAACKLYEECLGVCREIGDKDTMGLALLNHGYVAYEQKAIPKALGLLRESLGLFHELNSRSGIVYSLVGLAAIIAEAGNFVRSVQLIAAAETLRISIQLVLAPDGKQLYEQAFTTARRNLSEAEFNAAWETGRNMSQEEILRTASEIR